MLRQSAPGVCASKWTARLIFGAAGGADPGAPADQSPGLRAPVADERRGLATTANAELAEDVVHVVFHSRQRDGQALRDLLVRETSADQLHNLTLARRQDDRQVGTGAVASLRGEPANEGGRDTRGADRLSACSARDGGDELRERPLDGDEAVDARLHMRKQLLLAARHR